MNSGLSTLSLICILVLLFGGPIYSPAAGASLVLIVCTAGVLDLLSKILEAVAPTSLVAAPEPARRPGLFARFRGRSKRAAAEADLAADLAESRTSTRAAELAARQVPSPPPVPVAGSRPGPGPVPTRAVRAPVELDTSGWSSSDPRVGNGRRAPKGGG